MTARRIPVARLSEGERRLEGAAAHHLADVLRVRAGEAFVAFDPTTGLEADALILTPGPGGTLEVRFGPLREGIGSSDRSLTWIQALTKGKKCDAVVRDATELGATRIVVAVAKRSVARPDPAKAAARAVRWTRIGREAARQCGRSAAPRVDVLSSWAEALASVDDRHERFCLWERATEPLGPRLLAALGRRGPLGFACGPEGGLDDDEIELARARRWSVVSLGPRLLRTETVAAAVLGAVEIVSRAVDP